jgi:hypothetical protein
VDVCTKPYEVKPRKIERVGGGASMQSLRIVRDGTWRASCFRARQARQAHLSSYRGMHKLRSVDGLHSRPAWPRIVRSHFSKLARLFEDLCIRLCALLKAIRSGEVDRSIVNVVVEFSHEVARRQCVGVNQVSQIEIIGDREDNARRPERAFRAAKKVPGIFPFVGSRAEANVLT